MVKYVYDAWGNHAVEVLDSACAELSQLNPYRYRGYYYDTETGLYFLKTRYYDPEIGRFITIDDLSYIDPETINGLNLYAYCTNNPVMNIDPNGTWSWKKFWNNFKKVATIALAVGAVVGGIALSVVSMGALTPLAGFAAAVVGGALLGMGGAVLSNISSQVKQNGWDNVNLGKAWKAGGIGALGGAITGALSFGVGKIAEGIGQSIGFALGQMSVKGLQVSKVFSAEIMMTVFGKSSSLFGAAMATYFGDYIGGNLFGNSYTESNAKDTMQNIMLDWILQFGRWLYKL